jgi:hypothetical protein
VPKGKTPISSSDFSSLTGTLSFTSGSNTAQTLTLTPTNDTALEVGETFELQLYEVVGTDDYTGAGSDDIELATGMVTISDNDTGSFGSALVGSTTGNNTLSSASSKDLSIDGGSGNDSYIVTRHQYGDVAAQLAEMSAQYEIDIVNAGATLSIDDMAALTSACDLVVCVDTMNGHLAGGLGVDCVVVLPFSADWRWHDGRDDTPWYAGMRLFRQPAPADWQGVVAPLRAAVQEKFNL